MRIDVQECSGFVGAGDSRVRVELRIEEAEFAEARVQTSGGEVAEFTVPYFGVPTAAMVDAAKRYMEQKAREVTEVARAAA